MILLIASWLASAAAGATEFRVLTSWMPNYVAIPKIIDRYAEKVAEASDDETRFVLTGPDAIPPFEQLQPVALGIYDMLFTHGAFHVETTGIGVALDAITAEPAILRSSGVWEAVDRHYQTLGLKLLALPVSATGHNLLLRQPVDQSCDLAGRRIRASAAYDGLLAALGATAVTMPASDVHTALERNMLDGAAWPTIGALEHQWYAVSRYLLRPSFGSYTYMLLMNLETWNGLGVGEQTILLAEGIRLEEKIYKRFKKTAAKEENELKIRGMQTTDLCGAALKQLPLYWADSVWAYAIRRSGDGARRLRELALTAGITY